MKKILLLIISVSFLMNCVSYTEKDCALFDPIFPNLYIKLIDSEGSNLIENGVIDPNTLMVEGDFSNAGFIFSSENEESSEFNNTLNLSIPNELITQYMIHLNDVEAIKLNFKTEKTEILCNISYYTPTEVKLENENLEIIEIEDLQYLITIEL